MATMKAAVIYEVGGPEVLKLETRPIPTPKQGEVLIRVKAFGLNRSELFTRQGHSSSVKFPRRLGIEAVGLVELVPGGEFRKGDVVATAMGGMGRWQLRRIHLCPCDASADGENRARLGHIRRRPGDAADGLGFAVQIAPPRKRRTLADPRWHDLCRLGGRRNRQETWRLRRRNHAQTGPREATPCERS